MPEEYGILAAAIRRLDARLRALSVREPKLQAWQAPALLNSWANVATYTTAGYWRDQWGIVHLRGRVSGGAFPSEIFVLPEGYRPVATSSFLLPDAAVVHVESDGSVLAASTTGGGQVALDAITFRAEL